MKKILFSLVIGIVLITKVYGQVPYSILKDGQIAYAFSDGDDKNASSPNLKGDLFELFNETFDSIANSSPIIGFSAAVVTGNGTSWKRAAGLSKALPETPLKEESLMGIGSITKTFVATALLKLVEEKQVSLDDTIGKFVGPYQNIPGYVTIRDILSHRSGLNDYLNENPASSEALQEDFEKVWELDEILNKLVLQPNFKAGESWSYSNTNYLLAGRIIEKVTEMPWYEYLRKTILVPLNLNQTYAYPWEEPTDGLELAHLFADILGNGGVQDIQGFGISDLALFSMASSAGCLISTPSDVAHFMQQVLGGKFFDSTILDEMHKDYIADENLITEYGLGVAKLPILGQEALGHNGNIIYQGIGFYFPGLDISISVLQNDERSYDPEVANSPLDLNNMFEALLHTYLEFQNTTTGIHEENGSNELEIYPNPASNSIVVKAPLGEPISIFNMMGENVYTGIVEKSLDISLLPKGLYVAKTQSGQSVFVHH